MNSSIVWAAVPKQCEIEGKVSQVASKQSGGMGEIARLCSRLWVNVASLHSVAYTAMDCDLES